MYNPVRAIWEIAPQEWRKFRRPSMANHHRASVFSRLFKPAYDVSNHRFFILLIVDKGVPLADFNSKLARNGRSGSFGCRSGIKKNKPFSAQKESIVSMAAASIVIFEP